MKESKPQQQDDTGKVFARVDRKLKDRFDGKLKTQGKKAQYVVGKLIELWVEGKIDV